MDQKTWSAGAPIQGGEITSPQDQTAGSQSSAAVQVDVGGGLSCAVSDAVDTDHWVQGGQSGDEPDQVTYTWSCSSGGFVVGRNSDGTPQLAGTAQGQSASWIAPGASGTATLTCTIDDLPTPVTAPDGGTRDDAAVVRTVQVQVSDSSSGFKNLLNGVVRACAGGVYDGKTPDGVHTCALPFSAKDTAGNPLANQDVTFTYDPGSVDYSGGLPPRFIDGNGTAVTALTEKLDGNGSATVTVLSSDLISSPALVATVGGVKVARVSCNFVGPMSLRRFGVVDYVDKVDNGWLFNQGTIILGPGLTTPAKVYIKFQKAPTVPIDGNYFFIVDPRNPGSGATLPSPTLDANGDGVITPDERTAGKVRRPLDDDGNWAFVNGHKLHITIAGIDRFDGATVAPTDIPQYATLLDGSGQPAASLDVVTTVDGGAQVNVKSGSMIQEAQTIYLQAEDMTAQSPPP